MTSPSACIRRVTAEEVHQAWLLQAQGSENNDDTLPEEEYELRQREAPDLFWGYFENGRLIGFASASLTSESKVTARARLAHDPDGSTVCLNTLRVHPDYHGKGIETVLIDHLLWYVEENLKNVNQVSLVCRDTLIQFYEGLHFRCLGPSMVSLGVSSKQWFDMEYKMSHENTGFA
ncbi:serotonin N-acetyltransferase-like isoform X2 [Patiria miniata]|uniref:Serotonin N-acetyltransferase n=1 Tax=Patiria miniata TaxID=46514 RepID=A0A914A1U6_PATMI|nr:serotonin N-acetyltransferase-like isoform X2 [Patiria miniata]